MNEDMTISETTTNETNSEASATTVETVDESVETSEIVTTIGISNLSEIDVESLNTFTYIGTSFILACLFWFVCKWLYRLFNMFF